MADEPAAHLGRERLRHRAAVTQEEHHRLGDEEPHLTGMGARERGEAEDRLLLVRQLTRHVLEELLAEDARLHGDAAFRVGGAGRILAGGGTFPRPTREHAPLARKVPKRQACCRRRVAMTRLPGGSGTVCQSSASRSTISRPRPPRLSGLADLGVGHPPASSVTATCTRSGPTRSSRSTTRAPARTELVTSSLTISSTSSRT